MIRRPPRATQSRSSAASDVYKRQRHDLPELGVAQTDAVQPPEHVRIHERAGHPPLVVAQDRHLERGWRDPQGRRPEAEGIRALETEPAVVVPVALEEDQRVPRALRLPEGVRHEPPADALSLIHI